jgi:hypothetical protein
LKALTVGDTHFPWTNWDHLNQILDDADWLQPTLVVQMGDEYDFYSFSRFAKTLNLMTPKEEVMRGREEAEEFWKLMQQAAPKARCIQLLGNHDERLMKTVLGKAPELEGVLEILDYLQLWRFPGVELVQEDPTEEFILDTEEHGEILFQHGHRAKIGDHARYNGMNTVVGHSHRGGTEFIRYKGRTIWELNAGYIADQNSKPLNYNQGKISNSVPGYGIIDERGPRFIYL